MIQWKRARFPFKKPLQTAKGPIAARESILLRQQGCPERFAEIAPFPPFGSETIDAAESCLGSLGENPDGASIASLSVACPATAFGLDCLLRPLPVLSQLVPSACLLGMGQLDQEGLDLLKRHDCFKIKCGAKDIESEVASLIAILQSTHSTTRFRLDPNQSWSLATARRWLSLFPANLVSRIDYIEDPFRPDEVTDETMLAMSDFFPFPIALDERLNRADGLRWFVEGGWQGVFVIKPAIMGAPREWLDLLAQSNNRIIVSSVFESPFAFTHLLRIAAHFPGEYHGLGTQTYFKNPLKAFSGPLLDEPEWAEIDAVWSAA